MTTPIAIRRVPEQFPGASIINENFQSLKVRVDRYLDTQFWSPLTTAGDLLTHDGTSNIRKAIGASNTLLTVESGMPSWRTLTAMMDLLFGSNQGSILYRNNTQWTTLGPGVLGRVLQTQGAGSNPIWASVSLAGTQTPGAAFGDGNDAASVVVGLTGYIHLPLGGTITGWWLVADVASTLSIDVWLKAGALPSAADKISASAGPSLTAAQVASSTTLTGWSTTITAGDVLGFYLASLSSGSPKQVVLVLKVE